MSHAGGVKGCNPLHLSERSERRLPKEVLNARLYKVLGIWKK